MARAMFEYTKTILEKVSFNTALFSKELKKAVTRLLPYAIQELEIWIKQLILQNPDLKSCVPLLRS